MNAFKVHFCQFDPIWFLAIISRGRRETSTFLAFPGLLRPRTLTSFNILPGIVFLYFWQGINQPQLTVTSFDSKTPTISEKQIQQNKKQELYSY